MNQEQKTVQRIKFSDVKAALLDSRFRETLPEFMSHEIAKFLQNPGCACNAPIYRRVIQECGEQLRKYFPSKEVVDPRKEDEELSRNYWTVINCHIDELQGILRNLYKHGRQPLTVARYEDQLTVVVNETNVLF